MLGATMMEKASIPDDEVDILAQRVCERILNQSSTQDAVDLGRGSQNIIDKYLISAGTSSSSCASSIRPMSSAAVGVEARTKPLKSQQSSRKFGGLSEELSARFPTIRTSQSRRNVSTRQLPIPFTGGKRRAAQRPVKSGKKTKSHEIVHKDLILIDDPSCCSVPTHRKRIELEKRGLVLHEFPFDKSWDEQATRYNISEGFPILSSKNIDYEFMKACYGELVQPQLAMGVGMTGARLVKMAGQGAVYIRAVKTLCLESDADELCADMDDADIIDFEDLIKQCDSSNIEQVPGETENPDVAVLKVIFPDTPEATIKEALDLSADSREMAASSLVSWSNDEASSSSNGLTRSIPVIDVDTESPENSKEVMR